MMAIQFIMKINFKNMETNTLVTHKKFKNLGIGCVSKILTKSVRVNFGTDSVKTCKEEQLILVDVSKCKTVSFNEYRTRILNDNSILNDVIIGNELRHYVGIGWCVVREIRIEDLTSYPRVIF